MIKKTIFTSVIFLILSTIISTKADDIRDFEIEGMSVGDSLLNYVDEAKIIMNIRAYYENFSSDNFYATGLSEDFFKVYDSVDIHLKKNDNNYKIYSLDGLIFYEDINVCYKKMNSITKELSNQFINTKEIDYGTTKHEADNSGDSTVKTTSWYLESGDVISIECYYWSDKMKKNRGWGDHLRISVTKKKIMDWLIQGSYN